MQISYLAKGLFPALERMYSKTFSGANLPDPCSYKIDLMRNRMWSKSNFYVFKAASFLTETASFSDHWPKLLGTAIANI